MKNRIFLFCLFFFKSFLFCGFSSDTLIKKDSNYISMDQISVEDVIDSYCFEGGASKKKVVYKTTKLESFYVSIVLENEVLRASIDQKFFTESKRAWISAVDLKKGDILLCRDGKIAFVYEVHFAESEVEIFDITVQDLHTYFVSKNDILVHNVIPFAIGLSWVFGSGAVQFAGVSLGAAIFGSLIGCKIYKDRHRYQYNISVNQNFKDSNSKAPGKPTEKDGFIPSKNSDGKKVKHPKTGQCGWPDRKGHVWVPSGPRGHGGPHWDVVDKKGRHRNIVPGGGERGKK